MLYNSTPEGVDTNVTWLRFTTKVYGAVNKDLRAGFFGDVKRAFDPLSHFIISILNKLYNAVPLKWSDGWKTSYQSVGWNKWQYITRKHVPGLS